MRRTGLRGGGVMKILCEESRALRRGKEEPFHVSIFMFMHGAGARRPRPQTPRTAAGLEEPDRAKRASPLAAWCSAKPRDAERVLIASSSSSAPLPFCALAARIGSPPRRRRRRRRRQPPPWRRRAPDHSSRCEETPFTTGRLLRRAAGQPERAAGAGGRAAGETRGRKEQHETGSSDGAMEGRQERHGRAARLGHRPLIRDRIVHGARALRCHEDEA